MRRSVVLYDADCGLCKWLLSLLLRWDRGERLQPVALGSTDADALLADLSPEERAASWHLISPEGVRASAGQATAPLLSLLPGGRVPAAAFAALPRQAEWGYAMVATHRSGISKLVPARAKHRAGERIRRRESEGR